MRHATILVAVLAFVPLHSATAQAPIRPGARVRVTGPPICPPTYILCVRGPRLQSVGTFLVWKSDTLVVQSNGDILALPLDSVTTLEVSAGRRSQTGLGAGIGSLTGVAIGVVVGAASCTDEVFVKPTACAAAGGVIFGAAGALLGALIGATMKTERWVSVPLDQLRVSFVPQRDGRYGLGASVRF